MRISFVVLHHRLIYNSPMQNSFFTTIEGPLIRYIGERKYTVDRIVPLFKAIESVYREYIFDWIEVQANCKKRVGSNAKQNRWDWI
jgi:hypothetical protein